MTERQPHIDFRAVYAHPAMPVDSMSVEMTKAALEEAAFTVAELRMKAGIGKDLQSQLDDNEHEIIRYLQRHLA